ncbi:MAG: type II secretion system protein J [Phycisphaerae bacterium]
MNLNSRPTSARHGFTLVEIMIAVALTLVIIAGITSVFSIAGETIGVGQSVSERTRTMQAVASNLQADIVGPDAADATGIMPMDFLPFLVISNRVQVAFLDEDDEELDADTNVNTVDLDEDGIEGNAFGENLLDPANPPISAIENRRVHRTDTLHFFSNGSFKRQTGQVSRGPLTEEIIVQDTALTAYVWYGHLNKIAGGSLQILEAAGQQRYAAEWTLGRKALLLSSQRGTTSQVKGQSSAVGSDITAEEFAFVSDRLVAGGSNVPPFSYGSQVAFNAIIVGGVGIVADSAYAVGGSTLEVQNGAIDFAVADLIGGETNTANDAASESVYDRVVTLETASADWWQTIASGATVNQAFRYEYVPNVSMNNLNSGDNANRERTITELAQNTGFLSDGVTKFIVEFAGDFNGDGRIDRTAAAQDDPDEVDAPIQWYGLPRDLNGDGVMDVITVSDRWSGPFAFERVRPTDPGIDGRQYTCVWAPQQLTDLNPDTGADPGPLDAVPPAMLRITVELVDPRGKMNEPMRQEFIYRLNP